VACRRSVTARRCGCSSTRIGLGWPEVWDAAGTWHDVFGIEPQQLVESLGGVVTALKCGCTQSESMIDRAVAMVSSTAELRAAPFG